MQQPSDADLVEAARHGESAAFDVLFRRYFAEACEYSSRFASPEVAPERVTVAFARVYRALLRGRELEADFQAVLQSSVRGVHADVVRQGRKEFLVDDDELSSSEGIEDDNPIRPAFASLSASWRKVLWYGVVLDESDEEVADRLGLTPKQVGALELKARGGLSRACLAAGLPDPDDLGDALRPSLVLDVPGTTAGRTSSTSPLAGLVSRLPDTRRAVLAAVGATVVVTLAALVGVALTNGSSDDEDPAAEVQAPSSPMDSWDTRLPSSGQSIERGERTVRPTNTPTSETPSLSESAGTSPPVVETPSEPPSPTGDPSAPSPTLTQQGASASGSGLFRVARVTYGVTPRSADQVVVAASNARSLSVTGAGVLCSGQSVSGGEGVVTCRVVASQDSEFSLTIQVTYADPDEPVSGSVTLTGAEEVVSDGFTVAGG